MVMRRKQQNFPKLLLRNDTRMVNEDVNKKTAKVNSKVDEASSDRQRILCKLLCTALVENPIRRKARDDEMSRLYMNLRFAL
mmetsp:Transcript_116118/g.333477  ORF Transcript_116118/g.333477 Transcript_116118/m.333477 type:complete len:82 (-) Transcript_116118:11-256(-)